MEFATAPHHLSSGMPNIKNTYLKYNKKENEQVYKLCGMLLLENRGK